MPFGNTPNYSQIPANPIVPVPATSLPPADPGLAERQAGTDLWKHVTLMPTSPAWSSLPARVDFSRDTLARLVTIYAPAGTALYIGLDKACSPTDYDLYHPGGGFLEERVMPTSFVTIYPVSGVAPGVPIDVWGKAGSLVL